MTPKEKAKEMLCKFGECAGTYLNETVFGISKRSALLCCDEVISTLSWNMSAKIKFWQQVKDELQKL